MRRLALALLLVATPALADDKATAEILFNEGQKLMKLIEDGEIVVNWNAGDQGVIAYGKGANEQGGMVLTNSGVQRMTADELRQALAGR